MAQTIDTAKRVINGTFGELWIDAEKVAECTACQIKVNKNKDTINLCGKGKTETKATRGNGTGRRKGEKEERGLAQKLADLQSGIDRRFTVFSKLKDPDSWGAERVAVYNVSFDDLTLADWQAATVGRVTAPFTYSHYELLDQIVPA